MERIVDEFMEMVRIDVASRNERAIADAVIRKLQEIGCSTWEDDAGTHLGGNAGNVYGVLQGDVPGAVLFSAHLDRVANGLGIEPRIDGSKIVSADTILAADDIAGVAAILDGLRRIKASGEPHARVEVLFSVCEEEGVSGSKHLDYDRIHSQIGYVLDSPGRIGRVVRRAPTKARVGIEVRGRSAHAGNAPEQGVNAVVAAAKLLASVPDGRIDADTTANFSTFEAKGPTNVVNDYAFVRGEVRSVSDDKLDAYIREFEAICRRVAAQTGAVIEPRVSVDYRCFDIPESSDVIGLIGTVFADMGIAMSLEQGGGGMDANRLNANGVACVGVATGYSANHSTAESLEIDDLIRAGEMVERIVRAYTRRAGAKQQERSE